jgi:hypothetical protein
MQDRQCLECGKKVSGRVDKKFCSDPCRVAYYNKNGAAQKDIVKKTNQILLSNYRTLLKFNKSGKTKVKAQTLIRSAFDFHVFTGMFLSPNGTYYYCYDQGYLKIDGDIYLLVEKTRPGVKEYKPE